MSNVTTEKIKELRERTGVGLGKCKSALEETGGDIEKAIEVLRKAGIASAVKKESREAKEGRIECLDTNEAIAIVEMNAETDFVANNERFKLFHPQLLQDVIDSKCNDIETFLETKSPRDEEKTIDVERKELIAVLGENIVISRVMYMEKKADASYGTYSHMGGKIFCMVELSGASGEEELAREIAMHIAAESPDYLSSEDVPADVKAKEEEIARSQVTGNKPAEIVDKIISGKVRAFYDQVCLLNQKFVKDPNVSIAELVEKRGKEIGKELKVTHFIRWYLGGK